MQLYSANFGYQERREEPLTATKLHCMGFKLRENRKKKRISFLYQHPTWEVAASVYRRGWLNGCVTATWCESISCTNQCNKRQSHLSSCGKSISVSHLSYHSLGPATASHYLQKVYYFFLWLILQFKLSKLCYFILKYDSIIILIIKNYQNKGREHNFLKSLRYFLNLLRKPKSWSLWHASLN